MHPVGDQDPGMSTVEREFVRLAADVCACRTARLAELDLGSIAGETRQSYKRRFIVAWHEAIPSSFPLDPIEPLLDVSRAAHLLGISVKTLRDWIQARRIEYVKVGARVMIRPETIRQFVTHNTRRAAIG
jgi:excisionase family DNA binding protein